MITKGIAQEQKSPILFNMTTETNLANGDDVTAYTIFKRSFDFSKIDHLFYISKGKLDGATGTGYIKAYVNSVLKTTNTIIDTNSVTDFDIIDCTSLSGYLDVEIKFNNTNPSDNLVIEGIYLGVVDT